MGNISVQDNKYSFPPIIPIHIFHDGEMEGADGVIPPGPSANTVNLDTESQTNLGASALPGISRITIFMVSAKTLAKLLNHNKKDNIIKAVTVSIIFLKSLFHLFSHNY